MPRIPRDVVALMEGMQRVRAVCPNPTMGPAVQVLNLSTEFIEAAEEPGDEQAVLFAMNAALTLGAIHPTLQKLLGRAWGRRIRREADRDLIADDVELLRVAASLARVGERRIEEMMTGRRRR